MIESIVVCVVYIILLTVINKITGIKYTELIKNENNIKKGLLIPVAICTLILFIFLLLTNNISDVFSFSPTVNNKFLWVVPIIIVLGIIARFSKYNLASFTKKGIIYLIFSAFLVGFSEELLVRGFVVNQLNDANYNLFWIAIISSLIFGLLHSVNFLTGQDAKTTAMQVITTTLIGINFFVVLTLTGSLWVPILLHFLHDLSIFVQGGKINDVDKKISNSETVLSLLLFLCAPISLIILCFI